ncbi:MAG TPA: hypothetical protein VEO58_04425 [Gemmatimonadales bacterium]|nr:hypothetical protein [Gemmatimonadales bacterium]
MDASAVLWLSGSGKFVTPVGSPAQLANASGGPIGCGASAGGAFWGINLAHSSWAFWNCGEFSA